MSFLDLIKKIIGNGKKNARFITKTLIKTYGDPDALEVGLYDGNTPITDEEIGIEINGRQYIKTTDENGIATLNINLGVGKYTAKVYWRGNKEYNNITGYAEVIISTDTYMDGINLTKNEGDSTPYQCALYRADNRERIKDEVKLTINGRIYTREADNDGLYKLNINLSEGTYNIKAEFNGNELFNPSSIENTITINKPVQTSENKKPIILGCDANTSDDSTVQNRIAERLQAEGYSVEKLPIGPNYFASTDYSSKAKGKIGIYLIASGIFSIADAAYGSGQFDNYIFGIRGDFGDKGATCFDCPIRADADCTSICDELDGKTFNQINNMLQPYVSVCGGSNTDELANNIINWLNGLEQDDPEPTPEPEPEQPSTELYEYFTNQGGGYLGQKTGYTCACHSLVQCFHRLTGEDVSEMTLASVCGTTTDGTDHDGINTGVAWFNREYNQDIKIDWFNFSELGNNQDERFNKVQEMINNGAVFFHLLYRNQWGHYEVIKEAWDDPLVILNSLGDDCGDGYCGYIEYRSRSDQVSYINGISQKSVAYLHY